MAYEPKQTQDLSSTKASTAPVDYYSVLTNVIALVMKDPAQMRGLVYELARITLKREAWNRFPPLQGAELKAQLATLEQAIARVELDAQADRLRKADALREVARIADETYQPREVIILPERPSLTQAGRALHVPEQRRSFWREAVRPDSRYHFNLITLMQLVTASFIGVAVFAFVTGQIEITSKPHATPPADDATKAPLPKTTAPAPAVQAAAPPEPAAPALPFPMPSNYGVFAINEGQLVELERLSMRVPDARVLISPDITVPSRTVVASGKVSFVVYRRDLAGSTPEKVPIRVVARVAREMVFKDGKAVVNNVDNIWRIRSNSYDFKVGPVAGNREMILIAPENDFELPAGRYVLVLNGLGYDFTVAGAKPSPAHCLERTELTGGPIFTECRAP